MRIDALRREKTRRDASLPGENERDTREEGRNNHAIGARKGVHEKTPHHRLDKRAKYTLVHANERRDLRPRDLAE